MENEERYTQVLSGEGRGEIVNRAVQGFVYIILAAFCFGFGYWMGTAAIPEATVAVNEAVVSTNTEVMAEIWYEVCTEDEQLCLYRVSSADRALLAREEISTELFPYEDRRELKSGLIFESFDAALSSFEDFVS